MTDLPTLTAITTEWQIIGRRGPQDEHWTMTIPDNELLLWNEWKRDKVMRGTLTTAQQRQPDGRMALLVRMPPQRANEASPAAATPQRRYNGGVARNAAQRPAFAEKSINQGIRP